MLNLIRDNVQSFGVKFIVGIVVIVMSFFGISAYQSQSSNAVVTIDGHEIKAESFQRAYENAREEVRQRYGNQASEYLKMVNLESQVIRQLTNNVLLLKSASKNGLAVSDKELAYEIYNTPAFMTDNRFDSSKYENSLGNLRTDKIGFEKDLKENLLSQKFLRFVSNGTLVSRKSLEEEYRRFDSSMKINVIEFDPALFADQAKVNDQEIEAYYELHKSTFQQKSQFELNYFVLSIEDAKDKINVREKEVKKYYDNHASSEFTNKASFHSRHILIKAQQDSGEEELEKARLKADSIYQQLKKNPGLFATLAKRHSEDPGSARKGGDLGWVNQGSFVAEFESQVEILEINELSRPFLSNFGYHIVQVLDKKSETVKPFAEVEAEIEKNIRTNKAKRRLNNQVKKMLEKSDETPFAELAQSVNKSVSQTGKFDDTKQLKDIGYSYQLYQDIKSKAKNQKGQFKTAGGQQIILYEVANTVEPYVKPLAEVKEQVRYYAGEEKKNKLAKQKLTEFESSVTSLASFENVAKTIKTKSVPVSFKFSDRRIGNLQVSNRFKSEVFRMEENQTKAIEDSKRNYLVFLIEKKKGELDDNSREQLAGFENMMQNQKSQVILNSLINKLQKDVKVDYNMPLLDALNVQLEM